MLSSVNAQNKTTQLKKVRVTEITERNTAMAFKIHEIGVDSDGSAVTAMK